MKGKIIGLAVLAIMLSGFAQGQDRQDKQARFVFHLTKDINENWFITGWSVSNVRERALNNTNLFLGAGYRGKTWWLETMVQKQWHEGVTKDPKGNDWMLDFRFQKLWNNRFTLNAESSPFLTEAGTL